MCVHVHTLNGPFTVSGGGLGGTRRGGPDVNIKHSGRDDASRYDERPIGGG